MKNTLLFKNAFRSLFWCFALMLMSSQASWGQGAEDFTNIPTTSSTTYVDRSWTGTNSVTWTATLARTDQTLTGKAICTNGSGTVTSPSYSNGMGTLSFNYVRAFTGTNARTIGVYVNGIQQGSDITVSTSSNTVVNYSSVINVTGNVILELRTSGAQIKIDDISWTSYSALTTPALSADATLNTVDNPIDITFTDDSAWRAAVTAVKIGTTTLTSGTDYDLTAGNLQLKPSGLNAVLTTSGSKVVTIVATGYADATVTQGINAGVPTANSTATISAALAPNTTRTITATAKDQYNNLVSGYTFAYDVTITNNDNTTAESYTIDGSPFTVTETSGNPVAATTNASGVATFTAALPATIDANDGISIQVQLNDDTTNIGSAFTFTQLSSQTITFGALTPVTYGDAAFGLTATASSGLTVTYVSSNTAVATISGSTVTLVGAGSTNITASQAGNGSYNAATPVVQPLTVNTKALTLPDAAATNKVYTGTNAAVITGTLTGIINADNVTLIGTGTFADVNVANGIAVTSTSTLGGTKAGNYSLTQPTGLMADITQASQTITFGALANKTIGDADYSPGATSVTSGINPISYTSSNLAVATIVANQIHIVGVGTTNITAIQGGSSNYAAATDVIQTLTVTLAPIAAWDFFGQSSPATFAATTFDANLVATSGANTITRGTGAASSTGSNSFRTQGFQNNGIATANTDYFQVTIQASAGKTVSLSTIDANFVGTATFAASPGVSSQFAYSLDGTTFNLIGSPEITIGTPATVQVDLSTVTALQNVASGTTITLRYYASGQTTTGGWGFSSASAGINGLAIGGTVEALPAIWDGSAWSNTTGPTALIDAIIDGPYSTSLNGTISAKKLIVTSAGSLTINSNTNVTIQNELINNAGIGAVVVENNANLIQVNAIANTGAITVKRNSASLMRQDYTLWSSPVAGQQLQAFSPATLPNRFYTYNPASNIYVAELATNDFAIGTGYLIRMPNTHPTTPTIWTGTFTGVPNNETVTIPVTLGTFNAVGNPYPSTIDADAFITDNNIAEALYFWRKTNNNSTTNPTTSYATYTKAGGAGTTAPNSGDPLGLVPNGIIQVGQGFIAKSASSALVFTNSMKVADNANQFLRTSTVERNRIWLNLTNTAGLFSQTMVAYMTNATSGIDAAIDGRFFNDSQTALTSLINTEEFAIQGRALPFADSDIVPLGFKAELAGNYTIAIDHVDGLFTGGQSIYLKDNLMNATHHLNAGSYAFATAAGVFNNRFEIVYQNLLSVALPSFNENSVVVYKNSGAIHINAGTTTINNVKVFDISGRLVAEKSNVNATETIVDSSKLGTQVLIVQITSDAQIKVSKKLVN